jgi:hypothetical protein
MYKLYMHVEHMLMQRALPMIFWIARPSRIDEINLLFGHRDLNWKVPFQRSKRNSPSPAAHRANSLSF